MFVPGSRSPHDCTGANLNKREMIAASMMGLYSGEVDQLLTYLPSPCPVPTLVTVEGCFSAPSTPTEIPHTPGKLKHATSAPGGSYEAVRKGIKLFLRFFEAAVL